MYKKYIKITLLCLFAIFISTNVMQGQSTTLIDAIRKHEIKLDKLLQIKKSLSDIEYLSGIKKAIAEFNGNMYAKEYVSKKDSENLDALDHTFQIYDFEVFLKVFLLLLPHIENLQEKLDEQIKLACDGTLKDINKIALLIYLGAKCNVIDPDDEASETFIINIGTDFPTLELEEIHRQILITKIFYFVQQRSIYETAKDNKQLDELTDEQKQIGQLPKRKESIQIRIDSQHTLSF